LSDSDSTLSDELARRLGRVTLFVLDVDGTLTDGQVVYMGNQESQAFSVHDGQGLVWMRRAGVKLAWISGRGCSATARRAEELSVDFVELRCKDKRAALAAIQAELGIGPDETLAMGDDLPDLALARGATFFAAPADAREEVRDRADHVTASRAGAGAVREVCELCLRAKNAWRAIEEAAAG
jgi:3-deoxy-D-manno-octulosonate 8-phosphate phosphatase (KDO 8-P phosphatase)